MRKRCIRLLTWHAAVVLLAIVGRQADAQTVVLDSPADFSGPTTLFEFETFPDGSIVPFTSQDLEAQWASEGLIITDDSLENGASAYSGTFHVRPHSGSKALGDSQNAAGGHIEYHFVVPDTGEPAVVAEAGIWVQNGDEGSLVVFFDRNGEAIHSIPTGAEDFFAGIRAPQGIGSVRVTDDGFYMTDDLEFAGLREDRAQFRRGDANDSGRVDISDALFVLNWLFTISPRPPCRAAANFNGDDRINITDPTFLLNHLFQGGPAPPSPSPDCGLADEDAEEEFPCDESVCD